MVMTGNVYIPGAILCLWNSQENSKVCYAALSVSL